MIEAPDPPPQPIAAVLADVDGTLVTSAKVVTETPGNMPLLALVTLPA